MSEVLERYAYSPERIAEVTEQYRIAVRARDEARRAHSAAWQVECDARHARDQAELVATRAQRVFELVTCSYPPESLPWTP